jgi:Tfp pilus assembly protein PilF
MPKKSQAKANKGAGASVPAGKGKQQQASSPIRTISVEEFVRRLRAEANADKRFALFLGAGCSVTSGIPAAGELVKKRWIPRLHGYHASYGKDLDTWVREVIPDYEPANPAGSYGSLIDKLFLWPEERQREIELLCEGRTPSFGYAVLAQLIALPDAGFNVVLTTNFDDLIADALYLYTDARPLVIHHESLASYIRPTRTRPLVVKLHGDHRLSPRNTALETETLAKEIQRHTAMVLHDRGIIFMGYGGADHGILKMLYDLPSEALPFGAYWVHPEEPRGPLREWLASRQGVWVRSGWFDEVMLLVRNAFDLPHPSPERFTHIFDEYQKKFKAFSATIQKKPSNEAGVQALKKAVTTAEARFPDVWKAMFEAERLERNNPDRADEIYRQGIVEFQAAPVLLGKYGFFLHRVRKDYDAAEAMYKRALEADPKQQDVLGAYAIFLNTVRKDHVAAESMYRRAVEADPKDADSQANLAGFLLASGRAEGIIVLHQAMELLVQAPYSTAEIECAVYLFMHCPAPERLDALRKVRKLVESSARSPGWDFSHNIERARLDGHPEAAWLDKLASVIDGEAQPEILNGWSAWESAAV